MPHQVLDPCLLGRPVHLLPVFAAQLREDLAFAMRLPMSRRYWGGFQIDAVGFSRATGEPDQNRWLNFTAPHNIIGFSLERKMLLGVLNYRYSRKNAKPSVAPDPATVRVTATEDRLAILLGQQLSASLIARVRANLATIAKAAPPDPAELKALPGAVPAKGGWIIGVTVSDVHAGELGQFWFSLDKLMMADVLRGLSSEREQAKKATKSALPLASQLQVTLEGRLASKEVTLGMLLDLQIGEVIPISLSRASVLLNESRLFTAAVSEHKGNLCLTSFEDAE